MQLPRTFSFWFYLGMAFVIVLMAGRHFLFVPVQISVNTSRNYLFTGDTTELEISIHLENRLGGSVLLGTPVFRCLFEEGENLVVIRFNSDSTRAWIRPRDVPGLVILRILTPASVFPLYLEIPILAPTAWHWGVSWEYVRWYLRNLPEAPAHAPGGWKRT